MTVTDLSGRRRDNKAAERRRCLDDVRAELVGTASLLTACCTTLENHARMPEVERQLMAAATLVEGLAERIGRELE